MAAIREGRRAMWAGQYGYIIASKLGLRIADGKVSRFEQSGEMRDCWMWAGQQGLLQHILKVGPAAKQRKW